MLHNRVRQLIRCRETLGAYNAFFESDESQREICTGESDNANFYKALRGSHGKSNLIVVHGLRSGKFIVRPIHWIQSILTAPGKLAQVKFLQTLTDTLLLSPQIRSIFLQIPSFLREGLRDGFKNCGVLCDNWEQFCEKFISYYYKRAVGQGYS
jgi:hypothetical protein